MSAARAPAVAAAPPEADGDRNGSCRKAIKAFGDIALAVREATERDALLHLTVRKMCELVGVSRCSLYLREGDTGLYRGQVAHASRDIDTLVKRLVGGVAADRFTQEIVKTQAPVVLRDPMRDSRAIRAAMRQWGVRSMMGVPMVLHDEVIGIFFLDSEGKAHRFSDLDQEISSAFAELTAVAISQADLLDELRTSNEAVARRNHALRRAVAIDDRLTGLVISGGSLREIADAVSELTGKPCAVYGAAGRRLTGASSEDGVSVPPLHEGKEAERADVAEAIAAVSPGSPAAIGPFPRYGLNHRFLVAPVTVRDARWATLLLMEHGGRITEYDALISRRVSSVIALEMSAERRAAAAQWNARASLASQLIRGNRDVASVERQADFLGIRLDTPRVVCLLAPRGSGENVDMPDAEAVSEAISEVEPDLSILPTGTDEGIALIVGLPEAESTRAAIARTAEIVAEACERVDPRHALIAGMSSVRAEAPSFARGYEQARQVIACLDRFCPPGSRRVLTADDLGPGRLLLSAAEPAEARRFAEEVLGALPDADSSGELLSTLACFFENGRSVRRSATSLGVHENTIRYRLSKISELTGRDIAGDSDAQLSAQIALLVLRLQGSLPEGLSSADPDESPLEVSPTAPAEANGKAPSPG